MNGAPGPTQRDVERCGTCDGIRPEVPAEIANRPGLASVAYRVGAHPQFKQTLLARLPSLAGLTTRADGDFTVALLDAWAALADVLTFYQERIANESYLRTATERRSILELARLIGYELQPGVAASAYLTFTLEDAPGAPDQAAKPVAIGAGVKVQSIPGPGERPQVFETAERIEGRVEWNAIKPRLTKRHPIDAGADFLYFDGTATHLKPGDGLLVAPDDGSAPVFRLLAAVTPQPAAQRTYVQFQPAPKRRLFAFPQRALRAAALTRASAFDAGEALTPSPVTQAFLRKTITSADFEAIAQIRSFSVREVFRNLIAVRPPPPGVLAFRARASLFGHNAPDWRAMPDSVKKAYAVNKDANGNPTDTDWPPPSPNLDLDGVYGQITPGSWAAVNWPDSTVIAQVGSALETGVANYTFSAKVTRLTLKTNEQTAPTSIEDVRETTVFAQSQELPLARLPIEEPVSGAQIELDGWVDGLFVGQSAIVCGELDPSRGNLDCEQVVIGKVEHVIDTEGFTRITLSTTLRNNYVRSTVTINANVALATHGETVQEVLGSGDGSQPYQRFALRQPPVTYVSSPQPSGARSTLEVRVNDVLWHEAPTFYGTGPQERVFVTRTRDDGVTTVQFGDGITGARVPSGQENVRATYRKGIGLVGNVKAGQLSLLMTRPMGVRTVTNPLPASGAAEAETRDDARRNAALAILTLDRIVSLQDYEDFARAFAGVAKAQATLTWHGQTRGVFVTVAGPDGAAIASDGPTYANLLSAMRRAGDPHVPTRVQSYRKAFFKLSAVVTVDRDRDVEGVAADVESALRSQFSFEARAFGQPVALSEVLAVMQAVPGVVAVDVNLLSRSDGVGGDGLVQLLPAAFPQEDADETMLAAELLALDPRPLDIVGVTP